MRPEADIEAIVKSVCAQSGHWPYTRDADLYIGFRPGTEKPVLASDRLMRTEIEYDIVIAAKRGELAKEMEALRYRLYAALKAGGWALTGEPGPESYDPAHEMFMWPVTARKSFYADKDGLPEDIREIRAQQKEKEHE